MMTVFTILFHSTLFCLGLFSVWLLGLGVIYFFAEDDRKRHWASEIRIAFLSCVFGLFWYIAVPLGLVVLGVYGLYRSQKDSHA